MELKDLLKAFSDIMNENREKLIDMDSIVGDGDLGLTMDDGFKAAYESAAASDETDQGKLVYFAGKAMANKVPSTMGTLMASGLMQAGKVLRGKTSLEDTDYVTFFAAYEEGVMNRGKAAVGDKTFLDGIDPAVKALKETLAAGHSLKEAAEAAASAATFGFENTTTMLAVHGRAATRGEASRTLADPGAYVAKLMIDAFNKIA